MTAAVARPWRSTHGSPAIGTYADLDTGTGAPLPHDPLIVKGAIGADFDNERVQVYTASSTIVIFARSDDLARKAAAALTAANGLATKQNPNPNALAPASAGVVAGRGRRCGAIDAPTQ